MHIKAKILHLCTLLVSSSCGLLVTVHIVLSLLKIPIKTNKSIRYATSLCLILTVAKQSIVKCINFFEFSVIFHRNFGLHSLDQFRRIVYAFVEFFLRKLYAATQPEQHYSKFTFINYSHARFSLDMKTTESKLGCANAFKLVRFSSLIEIDKT